MKMSRPDSSSMLDDQQRSWIGKYFIAEGKYPGNPAMQNYVMEFEIARYARPYTFRVLFTGPPNTPQYMSRSTEIMTKSKPHHDFRPGQLNILVNTQGVIVDVIYS